MLSGRAARQPLKAAAVPGNTIIEPSFLCNTMHQNAPPFDGWMVHFGACRPPKFRQFRGLRVAMHQNASKCITF
jgi:hypothetical protein